MNWSVSGFASPLPGGERSDRIDRCDPGEGLRSIEGPEPLTPTLSHKGEGAHFRRYHRSVYDNLLTRSSSRFHRAHVICPSCQCAAALRSCARSQIKSISPSSRPHSEGRFAIVTDVGNGMRWTQAARLTSAPACGRRSRVVLTPRRWRQVSRKSFREATVANKPGHRGATVLK